MSENRIGEAKLSSSCVRGWGLGGDSATARPPGDEGRDDDEHHHDRAADDAREPPIAEHVSAEHECHGDAGRQKEGRDVRASATRPRPRAGPRAC